MRFFKSIDIISKFGKKNFLKLLRFVLSKVRPHLLKNSQYFSTVL